MCMFATIFLELVNTKNDNFNPNLKSSTLIERKFSGKNEKKDEKYLRN